MNLTSKWIKEDGTEFVFEYQDMDSFDELDKTKCTQTYGVCFYNDKMIVGYNKVDKSWSLVGGTIEKGETFEETLRREIKEEANMEILSFLPIGYQKASSSRDNDFVYQLRYVCLVKPFGPFISDPAGAITEIKLIDPKDYRQYFDWGEVGDRIIKRALELKKKL
jgi:8-oxo-dGTP pyrophosphatase MutT (NUDIX family)